MSTWPQSPSFPQKLATALNKTCTLHSAIHLYHRFLTINSCILTFIVSNRLYFPEYTYRHTAKSHSLLYLWCKAGLETQTLRYSFIYRLISIYLRGGEGGGGLRAA